MKRLSLLLFAAATPALAMSVLAMSALAGPAPTGRWVTASGNVEVEIAPCGNALCGTIVKVLANRSMAGPGELPKEVPGVGTQILSKLVTRDDAQWWGELLNRETGKVYDCVVKPVGDDEIEVRPYVGLPLFGQTQSWRRAP